MREIKFRAWDKKQEQMHSVYSINFFTEAVKLESGKEFGFDEMVLVQYTGLKDKNGKEIYEGDLINMHYRNLSVEKGEVVSVEMGMTYDSDGNANEKVYGWLAGKSSLVDVAPYAEILGNVYENKGLLT